MLKYNISKCDSYNVFTIAYEDPYLDCQVEYVDTLVVNWSTLMHNV